MKPEWVYDMWELSMIENVYAGSDEIYEQYKVPIFYNVNITITGIKSSERNKIVNIIENNGGHFHGAFKSEVIDVLLLNRNQITTAKYIAAKKCKTSCLLLDWIYDCVRAEVCLPIDKYRLDKDGPEAKISISTPTKCVSPSVADFNPNYTDLSEIIGNCTVNETIGSVCSTSSNDEHKSKLKNILF